ncbi:MAG: beta-lactamase family protein [Flavobacteriales bacterium]|nr:beta-lactamase family protein [Flavobacteriales bacterium]
MKYFLNPIFYTISIAMFFLACQPSEKEAITEDEKRSERIVAEIDSALQLFHTEELLYGTVLIADAGKVIYQKGFGYANHDSKDTLKPESTFRLASIGKQFTAMCLVILQEQGKLEYDDNIAKYLTELNYTGVTIRHLLWHTGGLPDYMRWMQTYYPKKENYNNNDVLKMLGDSMPPILFEPGEKFDYSNTGYSLLACIVERASGMSFPDFAQQHIFDKIGMSGSYVPTSTRQMDGLPNRALGYRLTRNNGFKENDDNSHSFYGDGGIFSNVNDLFKWNEALYTEKLVSKESIDEIFKPFVLNNGKVGDYGFGWFIHDADSNKIVDHSGGWVGFSTYIHRDITNQHCVIILTNVGNTPGAGMYQFCHNILTGKDNTKQYERFASRYKSTKIKMAERRVTFGKMSGELLGKFEGNYKLEGGTMEVNMVLGDEELWYSNVETKRQMQALPNDSVHFVLLNGTALDFIYNDAGNVSGFTNQSGDTYLKTEYVALEEFEYLKTLAPTYKADYATWKFKYERGVFTIDIPNEMLYVMYPMGNIDNKQWVFGNEPAYSVQFETDEANTNITKVEYVLPANTVVLEE